jgi:hypothetical protein
MTGALAAQWGALFAFSLTSVPWWYGAAPAPLALATFLVLAAHAVCLSPPWRARLGPAWAWAGATVVLALVAWVALWVSPWTLEARPAWLGPVGHGYALRPEVLWLGWASPALWWVAWRTGGSPRAIGVASAAVVATWAGLGWALSWEAPLFLG